MEQEIERKSEVANPILDFIDNQLEEINAKLKVSESDLESYKESNDVIILSDKAKLFLVNWLSMNQNSKA